MRVLLDSISEEKIVTFPEVDSRNQFYSHMRPCEAQIVFLQKGWDFDKYFKIVTVRNPWARLASLYKMVCRNHKQEWQSSFSEWIGSIDPSGHTTSNMPEKWYAHGVMSMTRFISSPEGRCMVNQVFKIEDQRNILCRTIAERTGTEIAQQGLAHTNKSPKPYDWRIMYSLNDRKQVAEMYADDIKNFGYSFDI